jgi:hypothetical protein
MGLCFAWLGLACAGQGRAPGPRAFVCVFCGQWPGWAGHTKYGIRAVLCRLLGFWASDIVDPDPGLGLEFGRMHGGTVLRLGPDTVTVQYSTLRSTFRYGTALQSVLVFRGPVDVWSLESRWPCWLANAGSCPNHIITTVLRSARLNWVYFYLCFFLFSLIHESQSCSPSKDFFSFYTSLASISFVFQTPP